jgi:hypothetical protein
MAFRRDALLSIGGFDPTYTKAGDDVDICWRLQERGHRLGFAPGALVFHHHRGSIGAYWRQQVGYGEGESFLQHRHADRFNARGHVRWAGRIYSPLPAYRSLFRQVVYQGRFGTEAFPSIYQGGLTLWGALPQTVEWQVVAVLLMMAAGVWPWILAPACALLLATCIGCARHAWASKIDDVAPPREQLRHRLLILLLHFVQPWARVRGRIRGYASDANFSERGRALLSSAPRLSLPDTVRLTFARLDASLWDTHYTAIDGVLHALRARSAGALTPVRCDDGFGADYDLILRAGRTYAFRLKLTAEDHGGMNRLFRARLTLDRALLPLVALGATLALLLLAALQPQAWIVPLASVSALALLLVLSRVSRHGGQVLHALRHTCREHHMISLGDAPAAPREAAEEQRAVVG